MIGVMFAFFIIFCLCLFEKVFFKKDIEDTYVFNILFIIFFLYLLGFIKILKIGPYILLIISILLLIISIIKKIKDKIKINIKKLITPSKIILIIFLILIFIIDYKQLYFYWDEFSHWGSAVKDMYITNSLGYNNNFIISMESYPQSLTILEYFFTFFNRSKFVEWPSYIAIHSLYIGLFLPFIKKINWKKENLIYTFLLIILIIFMPFANDTLFYQSIYSDGILGYMFAFSILYYMFYSKNDIMFNVNFFLIIFTLSYMKNYSVIFSIILLFLILLKNIIVDKAYKKNNRKKLLTTISFLAIVILLYIIWNCLTGSNVVSVKNEQDSSIKIFIYLLLGKDKGYRLKVLTKFIKKLFLGKFILKKISAFFVSLFLSSFLIIFTYHNKKTRKQNIVLAIGLLLGFIIYTLFLLFCYCVFFNKIEALNLSSFYRYLNSYLNALIMIDTIVIFNDNNKKSILLNNVYYYFLIILLFINPIGNGKKIFSRSYIKESYDLRMPYHEIANKFIDNIEENKNIYLLTQDYDKYSYHVFRYLLREKVKIIDAKYYSIVTKKEDIILSTNEKTNWDKMKVVSLEEIKKELFTDYDYLILYKYSDNFKNSYKELFENSNEIYSNSVYIVNKEKNKLQLKKR